MMSVPFHLCDVDDPPTGYWVIHLAPFNTFNINLAQVNPKGWQTLLCLSADVGEYRVDQTYDEIICTYFLKRNGLDKGRAYILCVVGIDYT